MPKKVPENSNEITSKLDSSDSLQSDPNMFAELENRVARCAPALNHFFAPPFDPAHGRELAGIVQENVTCDAVSFFLSKNDPNTLDFAAGVGYVPDYEATRYPLSNADSFLTSFVFKAREVVNRSVEDLQNQSSIPFSGRCKLFIKTKRIINILAVPILANNDRALGVLKLENLLEPRSELGKFPAIDVTFAKFLASTIGLTYQHSMYANLLGGIAYTPGAARVRAYLQSQSETLARLIRAECCSIFIKETAQNGEELLRYCAGVGYNDGYQDWAYQLRGKPSLTAHVARLSIPLRFREDELLQGKLVPYTGACVKWIRSGAFRNILAIPLTDEAGRCLGVLKIENKLPQFDMFNEFDQRVCTAFTRTRIVPVLIAVDGQDRSQKTESRGMRLLIESLGKRDTKKRPTPEEIGRTEAIRQQHAKIITAKDCADYFGISRAAYYRYPTTSA